MYVIAIYKEGEQPKALLFDTQDEIAELIGLLPKGYLVHQVQKLNYDIGKDFVEQLKEKQKPKDLVLGEDKVKTPDKKEKGGNQS